MSGNDIPHRASLQIRASAGAAPPLNASRYFCRVKIPVRGKGSELRAGGGEGRGGEVNGGMCFKVREHVRCARGAERKVLRQLAERKTLKNILRAR